MKGHLARHWEFDRNVPGYWKAGEHGETWTDYLGPQPYVDYTIGAGSPPVIEEQMRYLAGFGVHAQGSAGVPPAGGPVFLHGDLTRSTMMTTDTSATVLSRVAYTAFGDPVTPDGQGGWRVGAPVDMGTRYQYDGGWGYESGAWGPGPDGQGAVGGPLALWGENTTLPPVTLQHVGWRWYQPGIGRFIQRDPIGIDGGLNVYAYVGARPTSATDPSGKGGGHLYRDSKTGRFIKAPWWVRGGKWGLKRFPVCWAGKKAAQAGHKVTGAPWEDPEDIVGETLYYAGVYCISEYNNWRDRENNPQVFDPPSPQPPSPHGPPEAPEIPCGPHY